jgi:hypothetical protein
MKKLFLPVIILCIAQAVNADDSTDFFDGIAREFFQPFTDMTKLEGGEFNGYYLVQPDDNIPYREVSMFSWPAYGEYGLKYFSYSKRTSSDATNSIIEIYGQQFSLGFLKDEANGWPRDIMWSGGAFWTFAYNGKTFLSYITNQLGANAWYAAHVCCLI